MWSNVVSSTETSWSGKVTCFKTNPINCTLLARWDDDYADPWLILTDLKSRNADISWAARGSVQVASSDALSLRLCDFALGLNALIETSKVMVGNGTKLVLDNQTEPNVTG